MGRWVRTAEPLACAFEEAEGQKVEQGSRGKGKAGCEESASKALGAVKDRRGWGTSGQEAICLHPTVTSHVEHSVCTYMSRQSRTANHVDPLRGEHVLPRNWQMLQSPLSPLPQEPAVRLCRPPTEHAGAEGVALIDNVISICLCINLYLSHLFNS